MNIGDTFKSNGFEFRITAPTEVAVGGDTEVPLRGDVFLPMAAAHEGQVFTVTSIDWS